MFSGFFRPCAVHFRIRLSVSQLAGARLADDRSAVLLRDVFHSHRLLLVVVLLFLVLLPQVRTNLQPARLRAQTKVVTNSRSKSNSQARLSALAIWRAVGSWRCSLRRWTAARSSIERTSSAKPSTANTTSKFQWADVVWFTFGKNKIEGDAQAGFVSPRVRLLYLEFEQVQEFALEEVDFLDRQRGIQYLWRRAKLKSAFS